MGKLVRPCRSPPDQQTTDRTPLPLHPCVSNRPRARRNLTTLWTSLRRRAQVVAALRAAPFVDAPPAADERCAAGERKRGEQRRCRPDGKDNGGPPVVRIRHRAIAHLPAPPSHVAGVWDHGRLVGVPVQTL